MLQDNFLKNSGYGWALKKTNEDFVLVLYIFHGASRVK